MLVISQRVRPKSRVNSAVASFQKTISDWGFFFVEHSSEMMGLQATCSERYRDLKLNFRHFLSTCTFILICNRGLQCWWNWILAFSTNVGHSCSKYTCDRARTFPDNLAIIGIIFFSHEKILEFFYILWGNGLKYGLLFPTLLGSSFGWRSYAGNKYIWSIPEISGENMEFYFGWQVGTQLQHISSLVHTARSIIPWDDEITSLSYV